MINRASFSAGGRRSPPRPQGACGRRPHPPRGEPRGRCKRHPGCYRLHAGRSAEHHSTWSTGAPDVGLGKLHRCNESRQPELDPFTLDDSVVSSVTLAATNLWHAAGAGLYIPWADFTIIVDPTVTGNAMNTGSPDRAGRKPIHPRRNRHHRLCDLSTPITLATESATSEGTWTQAANQIVVAVPADTTPGPPSRRRSSTPSPGNVRN